MSPTSCNGNCGELVYDSTDDYPLCDDCAEVEDRNAWS